MNSYQATLMAEGPPGGSARADSTIELIERVKGGDADALDQVFARYLPALRRWASGRLPRWTRDLMSTDDLVQETFIRAMRGINRFEMRHEGALHGYLRQAIVNRVRDEVRRGKRTPAITELNDQQADHDATPLELAIGEEALQRYEAALTRLREEERRQMLNEWLIGYALPTLLDRAGRSGARGA